MTRHHPKGREPLAGFKPPPPPDDLRAQTLARARRAMERPRVRDRWRELWESRPLRLVWAAAVAALVAANLAVSARPLPSPARAARTSAAADDELRSAIALGDLRSVPIIVSPRLRLPNGIDLEPPAIAGEKKESTT